MAKAFAKKFYNSEAWKNLRNAYVAERIALDGGLCERCGQDTDNVGEELHHIEPLSVTNIKDCNVTLNHDNLQWLCKDCHFKVHREMILKEFEKFRNSKRKILNGGCYFDENGEFQKMSIKIVWGAPASGKTTFVKSKMNDGDLIVDLDRLKEAISFVKSEFFPPNLSQIAFEIRDFLYKIIEEKAVDCKNVWVVAMLPNRKEREELAKRLDAELIYMPADYHECIKRVNDDANRINKTIHLAYVDKFFETVEL